jgi:ketosteroid isomerase-like protein
MRSAILVLVALLCLSGVSAQAQGTDSKLQSELEALHAKWMKAFHTGDIAAMDGLEADNLVLIMPTGMIWLKNGPRADKQTVFDPHTEATLSDVSARRFGDTAILTGVLHTKSAKENSHEGTTVVFVKNGGQWRIASVQWTPVEEKK